MNDYTVLKGKHKNAQIYVGLVSSSDELINKSAVTISKVFDSSMLEINVEGYNELVFARNCTRTSPAHHQQQPLHEIVNMHATAATSQEIIPPSIAP